MKMPGLLLLIIAALFWACSEKEKAQEMKAEEGAGQISPVEQAENLIPKLQELQQAIQLDPQNTDLHKKLVALSVDKTSNVARAVGYGKAPKNVKSSAMAIQGARQAAYVDGCRWLAYILQWEQHPQQPAFGSIEGEIPGAKIVHKIDASDQGIIVLVESKLSDRK
ncbi:MAG: hypothetical protein GXO75_02035 [Calditrichaeota bacterium]|nr:hypothetical protein [Calditrichota bacterium]